MIASFPLLLVLAGPNGAGKSTFYDIFLRSIALPFVSADQIAKERFGSEAAAFAYEAAQIAEEQRRLLYAKRASFVMETVLSDPHGAKLNFFEEAKAAGYQLIVHFIGLESPALSQARVAQRVQDGGHDVPDEKLKARYGRTLANLARLLDLPDALTLYDNSSRQHPYRLVAYLENGRLLQCSDSIPFWAQPLNLPSRSTPETLLLP